MRDARRYNLAPAVGAGIAGTGAIAALVAPYLAPGAAYPLKAAIVFAVTMAGIGAVAGEHPYARFGHANRVTMIRAVLAALAAALVGQPLTETVRWWLVGVTACMAVMDGVDGWLARRTRMSSAFGARFDMEVDALFILVLSILVWQSGSAGAWVLLCGLMRYLFVVAGVVWPWMAGPLSPTLRGRAVAVGQLVGLGAALVPGLPLRLSGAVAGFTLVALAWSFAVDVRRLWDARLSS